MNKTSKEYELLKSVTGLHFSISLDLNFLGYVGLLDERYNFLQIIGKKLNVTRYYPLEWLQRKYKELKKIEQEVKDII